LKLLENIQSANIGVLYINNAKKQFVYIQLESKRCIRWQQEQEKCVVIQDVMNWLHLDDVTSIRSKHRKKLINVGEVAMIGVTTGSGVNIAICL
jgi:hypothetical protein